MEKFKSLKILNPLLEKINPLFLKQIEKLEIELNPEQTVQDVKNKNWEFKKFGIPIPQSEITSENTLGTCFKAHYIVLNNNKIARPGIIALSIQILDNYNNTTNQKYKEELYQLLKYLTVADFIPAGIYQKGRYKFADENLTKRLNEELELQF